MNKFRVKHWLTALCLVGGTLAAAPAWAAIPFELDGNAVTDAVGKEDWDKVNTNPYSGDALTRSGLIVDRPEPPGGDIFTGGGSKDEQDIPNWKWRSGTPPAKDDVSHAFAAQYTDPATNHEILVFGMDRYDTSGDAQLGFWFLQGEVMPVAGGNFSGEHQDGDILVLVNFSNGGTVPTIQVFKWENGAVASQGAGEQVLCNGGIPAGKSFCGKTNAGPVAAPWDYVNKDVGSTQFFPTGAFFEGAIDLGDASSGPCFTNFLTESRSSTSITAVLKDFAASSFPACSVKVTKKCSAGQLSGDEASITYTITGEVTNDGGGILHNVTLADDPVLLTPFIKVDCNNPANELGEFPLLTLGGGATVCYKNSFSVPLDQNGPSDTVTATAATTAGGAVTVDDQASVDCEPITVSPALTIHKECTSEVIVDGGQVVAKVNASVEVCNIGDSALSSVVVTDDHVAGNLTGPSLIAKGVCKTYTGNYIPSAPDEVNGEIPTNPADVMFSDRATVTASNIFGEPLFDNDSNTALPPPPTDGATCPLCTCTDCN
ncbi:hypothetical protein [Aeromonas sanarellii]|uniref:hypothetical protein n=1 Tax=Aeromonas sanarellii TaxID=633415 RepID=UPI003BA337E4